MFIPVYDPLRVRAIESRMEKNLTRNMKCNEMFRVKDGNDEEEFYLSLDITKFYQGRIHADPTT